ncbi:DUF4352 domain-containing protein [Candidatus Saccharibacteria bacterium]|nr:DUF4352 domain-containing protein [Candidatus Saccharibacteria bacterium]
MSQKARNKTNPKTPSKTGSKPKSTAGAKKPVYKQWWFWVIIVVVLLGIGATSSSNENDKKSETNTSEQGSPSSSTAENTNEYKVGDTISSNGSEVVVTSVERNFSTGNMFVEPEAGKEYVKVNISITNTGNSTSYVAATSWQMQDSNGVIRDYDFSATAMIDGALNSVELASGGKLTGALVFEVPQGDTGLVLQYKPSFLSKTILIRL